MPYGTLALLVALVATVYFMFFTAAPARAKALAGSVFGSSLVFTFLYPEARLAGLLLQCVLVVAVSLYLTAKRR